MKWALAPVPSDVQVKVPRPHAVVNEILKAKLG